MLNWPLAAALQQSFAWAGLYLLLPHATFQFPTKTEAFALPIAISTFAKKMARLIYFQQETNLYLAAIITLGCFCNCFDNFKLYSFF
jgi:hypothetical protein